MYSSNSTGPYLEFHLKYAHDYTLVTFSILGNVSYLGFVFRLFFLEFLPHFPPALFSQSHPHILRVLHPVHHQRHLLPQALGEVIQLLPLAPPEVVISLAEPEIDL